MSLECGSWYIKRLSWLSWLSDAPVTAEDVLMQSMTALWGLAKYCKVQLPFFMRLLKRLDFPRMNLIMV